MRVASTLALLATGALLLGGCGGGDAPRGTTAASTQGSESPRPPEPGSKAAAPGVPVSRYGDNSIQTWGLEASTAEREEAAALVQSYLDARAARDWPAVCSSLAAESRAQQGRIAGGVSCARGMALIGSRASAATLAEEAEIDVLSFRVGGGYAFLILRRPDGVFAFGLTRENGSWRVINVTPNPLA